MDTPGWSRSDEAKEEDVPVRCGVGTEKVTSDMGLWEGLVFSVFSKLTSNTH